MSCHKRTIISESDICSKFGLFELVNLIWLREVSLNGMVKLGMKVNSGRSTSVVGYGRLANKYGKMVLMIQKGRNSMYK